MFYAECNAGKVPSNQVTNLVRLSAMEAQGKALTIPSPDLVLWDIAQGRACEKPAQCACDKATAACATISGQAATGETCGEFPANERPEGQDEEGLFMKA